MLEKLIDWAANRYGRKEYFTPINAVSMPADEAGFRHAVGGGYRSNVILTPVQWVARQFPSAPLVVERLKSGEYSPDESHPMLELLRRPNLWYSGLDLWDATVVSRFLDGNAYWIKVRGGSGGRVTELVFAPPWMMEPRQRHGSPDLITHFRYSPRGHVPIDLPLEDVVHFRSGIDPENPRKGMSTLQAIIREVFTDDEGSRYTAHLLRNNGVPGLVVSPKESGKIANKEVLKKYLDQEVTGQNRGHTVVIGAPIDISQLGFDPRKMDVSALRNVSEERACAAVGVPCAVVGFGSGLETAKVGATMTLLRRLGWEDCIVPLMRSMAETLDFSLLNEWETRPGVRSRFAVEEVGALQKNEDELALRNTGLYRGGLIRRSEARSDLGWEVAPEDEGYVYEIEPQASSSFGLASASGGLTKEATNREQQAIDEAPRRQPTEAQKRLIGALEKNREAMEAGFAKAIEEWAEDFGDAIEEAASGIIKARKPNGSNRKDAASDTNEILTNLDLAKVGEELKTVFQDQHLQVAVSVYATVGEQMGLAIGLPDEKAAAIISQGGTNAGLIDLPKQTRKRLFEELEKARDAGLGIPETTRKIRDLVPAGPWKDAKTRARVIARTETLNAQRFSILSAYKDMGNVTQVMIFDNRTGFGDAECTALNGVVVSLDVAQGLMADEHPNGTRSAAPVVG